MNAARIIALPLALMSMALLGCAEGEEQEKKEEAKPPIVFDPQDLPEFERRLLGGVIKAGELNGKEDLTNKIETLETGLSEIQKRHPDVRIFEMCEYKGWLIYSRTSYSEETKGRRFHDGYAIKKGTKIMGEFGFW